MVCGVTSTAATEPLMRSDDRPGLPVDALYVTSSAANAVPSFFSIADGANCPSNTRSAVEPRGIVASGPLCVQGNALVK